MHVGLEHGFLANGRWGTILWLREKKELLDTSFLQPDRGLENYMSVGVFIPLTFEEKRRLADMMKIKALMFPPYFVFVGHGDVQYAGLK